MTIPAAPTNVVLQTGNGVNFLTWGIVPGATVYTVQRCTDNLNFVTINSPVVNSYLDSSVVVGTNYFYQVDAANGSGHSPKVTSYPLSITPCLPGQITLGYLRYLSQLRADKLNSQYLSVDEWNSNINQSIYALYDKLVTKFGDDYFMAPPLLVTLTGAQYYALPDGSNYPISGVPSPALYKLCGIDANISGASTGANAGWVPLARANWSDRDRYTTWPGQAGSLNNIYQMFYRVMGSNLYIFPQNQSQTLRLWYVPIMTQLLQDTDMLPFSISGWCEWVINDAAQKAMIKEESLEKWSALAQANVQIEERIETTAANRDVGQPNTVSNIRAVMGDPGFSNWGNGGGGFGGGWGGY